MSHAALSALVARTARAVVPPADTDGSLLTRFVRTRDEATFAELVRRLGPLVLGACRRVARDHDAAEDAFQAAFLVLVRRARDVRPAEGVRGWLYGVAVRCAKEARAVNARRRQRETPVARLPDRAAEVPEPPDADALAALDEEIAALPHHLRAAVVLCELDGLSRRDAAGRLGVAEGTLSSRLAKARTLLAERLRRRGFALPAVGLGVAAVPAELSAGAAALARPSVPVPVSAGALAHGVFRAMLLAKLKPAALVALGAALLGCAALVVARPPVAVTESAVAAPVPKGAHKPRPPAANKLLFWRGGKLVSADPDGTSAKEIALEGQGFASEDGRLSPDGKAFAHRFDSRTVHHADGTVEDHTRLHIRNIDDPETSTDLGVTSAWRYCWSPDGAEVICSRALWPAGRFQLSTSVVHLKTKTVTELKLPPNHFVTDCGWDGRLLTTSVPRLGDASPTCRLHLMNRDGTEHKLLASDAALGRLSPDGGRVLFSSYPLKKGAGKPGPIFKAQQADGDQEPPREDVLCVLDLATGKVTEVRNVPPGGAVLEGRCWSPDGNRIAYTWREKHEGKAEDGRPRRAEHRLTVCDADGANARAVVAVPGSEHSRSLDGLDWR